MSGEDTVNPKKVEAFPDVSWVGEGSHKLGIDPRDRTASLMLNPMYGVWLSLKSRMLLVISLNMKAVLEYSAANKAHSLSN